MRWPALQQMQQIGITLLRIVNFVFFVRAFVARSLACGCISRQTATSSCFGSSCDECMCGRTGKSLFSCRQESTEATSEQAGEEREQYLFLYAAQGDCVCCCTFWWANGAPLSRGSRNHPQWNAFFCTGTGAMCAERHKSP